MCELLWSVNMADQQDSATPPATEIPSTQPRVSRHLDGDEILAAFASIRDSFMYSAGINKDKETSGAGKTNI